MSDASERRQAAEALDMVRVHQERTERAARLPWWVYAAVFVLAAGGSAAADFVSVGGAKLMAVVIVVLLVAVLVFSFATRSSVLDRARGVRRREAFDPRIFVGALIIDGVGISLLSNYGGSAGTALADAVGLHGYPNSVTGVIYGIVFTGLFCLGRLMLSKRRTHG